MTLKNALGGLALDATIVSPDGKRIDQIGTTTSKFVDGFGGPNIAVTADALASLTKWNVIRNTGMAVARTAGALVITTGAVSGSELLLVGKDFCTIPQNLIASLTLSARNANQEIRVGYVEVDDNGVPIANSSLANFFRNHAAVLFTGTSNTGASLETLGGDHIATKVVNVSSQNASTGVVEYALEVRAEDVTYAQALADNIGARSAQGARISTMCPSPYAKYAPFIWLRNTAATGTCVVTVQRVISMDIQELQVEVGGGRGNNVPSQAIPVVLATPGATNNMRIADAAVTAGSNGGSIAKVFSAATNNLTNIKASAGRLWGGYLFNSSASPVYLRLYNANAIANVTMGTTSPMAVIPIPMSGVVNLASILDQYGLSFTTGITYAITMGSADLDNTVLGAAGIVIGTLLFV